MNHYVDPLKFALRKRDEAERDAARLRDGIRAILAGSYHVNPTCALLHGDEMRCADCMAEALQRLLDGEKP